MQNFDGGEAFQLQARVHRLERPQHVGVIAERQRGMQAADDVQFGHAHGQGLARFLRDFLDGELHAVGVALFAGEGAELAAQDAVVGVVDVAVDDVAGAGAVFAPANQIGERAEGVEVLAFKKTQGLLVGESLARRRPFRKGRAIRPVAKRSSPFEPHPWKHNFGQSHNQKDDADDGVEAEEGLLNPVQAAPPRQPMFEQQTAQNKNQARRSRRVESPPAIQRPPAAPT